MATTPAHSRVHAAPPCRRRGITPSRRHNERKVTRFAPATSSSRSASYRYVDDEGRAPPRSSCQSRGRSTCERPAPGQRSGRARDARRARSFRGRLWRRSRPYSGAAGRSRVRRSGEGSNLHTGAPRLPVFEGRSGHRAPAAHENGKGPAPRPHRPRRPRPSARGAGARAPAAAGRGRVAKKNEPAPPLVDIVATSGNVSHVSRLRRLPPTPQRRSRSSSSTQSSPAPPRHRSRGTPLARASSRVWPGSR